MKSDYHIETRVVEREGLDPYRVWDVNEGDGEEGTWSKIAEFFHEQDARIFVDAKKKHDEKIEAARKESLKRHGGVFKKLADM